MKTLTLVDAIGYIDDDLISGAVEYERKPFAARLFGDRTWRGALKKVAVVILALLIGAGVWLATDEGARAAFQRWWREVYENSVIYRFAGDTEETLPLYAPTWVPEGFELTDEFTTDASHSKYYQNKESGETIFFYYSFMQDGGQSILLAEGEMPVLEKCSINGNEADFYPADDISGIGNLTWFDETQNIVFSIDSELSKDAMLRIAESVALETQAQPALPLYAPTWVPEGFELKEDLINKNRRIIIYLNENSGDSIAFDYFFMDTGAQIELQELQSNTEVPDPEHLLIQNKTAEFYPANTEFGDSNLIWFDETENIVFSIGSSLSRDDILRIAESVNIEPSTNGK